MRPTTTTITLAAAATAASAGSLFTWSGTATGTYSGSTAIDSDFSLSIVIDDVSADLSAPTDLGSYAIQSVTLSVDGGTYTESLGVFDSTWSSLFVDQGGTGNDQLVAASNLFGSLGGDATFTVGALLSDAFEFGNVNDLSAATDFQVTGLASMAGSYASNEFNLDLGITGFSYSTNLNAIPLPQTAMMASVGLAGVGITGRRRP